MSIDNIGLVLAGVLSPDSAVRQEAERQIHFASQNVVNFPVILANFIHPSLRLTNDTSLQQMAAVILRQWVTQFWKSSSELTRTNLKVALVDILMQEMNQDQNIVHLSSLLHRSLFAVIAEVANFDWPDHWPDLSLLLQRVLNGSTNISTNASNPSLILALQCCITMAENFDCDKVKAAQLVGLAYDTILDLLRIQYSAEKYEMQVFCVSFLRTAFSSVFRDPESFIDTLQHIVPRWLAICGHLLHQLDTNFMGTMKLKMEVLRALTSALTNVPSLFCGDHGVHAIQAVLHLLTNGYVYYQTHYYRYYKDSNFQLNTTSIESAEECYTMDGEFVSFATVLVQAFEMLNTIIRSPDSNFRLLVFPKNDDVFLQSLLSTVLFYMRLTVFQLELWEQEPHEFVIEDDENCMVLTLRHACADFLNEIHATEKERVCLSFMTIIVNQILNRQSNEIEMAENSFNWWLEVEAGLYGLGTLASFITSDLDWKGHVLSRHLTEQVDVQRLERANIIEKLLTHILQTIFNCIFVEQKFGTAPPQLIFRYLWIISTFRGTFVNSVNIESTIHIIRCCLGSEYGLPIRLYACRAFAGLCEQGLPGLQQYCPEICRRACESASGCPPDVLHIIIDSLVWIVDIGSSVTDSLNVMPYEELINLSLAVWTQCGDDPFLVEDAASLLQVIMKVSVNFGKTVMELLCPYVSEILQSDGRLFEVQVALIDMISRFMDIIKKTRNEKKKSNEIDETDVLILKLSSQIICTLLRTDDRKIIQSGTIVLQKLMHLYDPEVLEITNIEIHGQKISVLNGIINLLKKILNEESHEMNVMFIGHLFIEVMIGNNNYIINKNEIFGMILIKLNIIKMPSVREEIILAFIRLILSWDINCFVNLIEENSKYNLEKFVNEWISLHSSLKNSKKLKTSILSMLHLIQYIMLSTQIDTKFIEKLFHTVLIWMYEFIKNQQDQEEEGHFDVQQLTQKKHNNFDYFGYDGGDNQEILLSDVLDLDIYAEEEEEDDDDDDYNDDNDDNNVCGGIITGDNNEQNDIKEHFFNFWVNHSQYHHQFNILYISICCNNSFEV